MVTPNRKRQAVVLLQDEFGVSQRRACRVVGQHRSTQRLTPPPTPTTRSGCATGCGSSPGTGPGGLATCRQAAAP